jgi:hypothetical protein
MVRIAVLALALCGCATETLNDWRREGATEEQLRVERGQCRAMALQGDNTTQRTILAYRSCMAGKGWRDVAHPDQM